MALRPFGAIQSRLARPALSVVLGDVLLPSAAGLALAAFATPSVPWQSRLHALAGLAVGALFVVDLPRWERASVALAIAHVTVVLMASWRGVARVPRVAGRHAVFGLGAATMPCFVVALGAALGGTFGSFGTTLYLALGRAPGARMTTDALVVTTVLLAADGARPRTTQTRALGWALTLAACGLACVRLAWIATMATLPIETTWSEPPALVNALKLDAHQPLYGDPARLDSYTYSPLLDLFHHALLAPVGLEVSLLAHRALIVMEQLGAFAVLIWALGPKLARAGWGWTWIGAVLLVLAFVNLLAASVHPDHLVLLAFSVALALLVAEPRWHRAAWWVALLFVAPLAASAKLTGVGVGIGLAVVFAMERRWRPFLVALASVGLAAATVPLFQATLGDYVYYAIQVQRAHPIEWHKIGTLPTSPYGLAALGAAAGLAWVRRIEGGPLRDWDVDVVRVAVLTSACTVMCLPAWLKYAGRDNNLTLLAVGTAGAWLLGMARHTRRASPQLHPWLGPAAALLGTVAFAPPARPLPALSRAAFITDLETVKAVVREEDALGRRTLVLVSAAEWIAAGHRGVPADRYQSAAELSIARLPEGDLLAARIAEGVYDTIITPGNLLSPGVTPVGRFNARILAAIDRRYAAQGAAAASTLEAHLESVVFRRVR